MDPSDIRSLPSQAPSDAKREGLERAAAAEKKKQNAGEIKALQAEEDDMVKAEIAQKHASYNIKVSSSRSQTARRPPS
jgi:hypothetical protein